MKVAHVSDTHGYFPNIPKEAEAIIHSGDLCPNLTRGNREIEVPYQSEWIENKSATFKDWIADRPFLFCRGNHDFSPVICEVLQRHSINAIDITSRKYVLNNIRFYGFPFIPYIDGEWSGECTSDQMAREVRKLKDILKDGLDVLVAHAPPYGVLDADFVLRAGLEQEIVPDWAEHLGNVQLTNLFSYSLEDAYHPQYLLVGHIHESGSSSISKLFDIKVSNAATRVNLIDLEI